MIDTDKYEGHTGPWKPHTIQPLYGNMVLFGFNEQDSMLSADAPLLLAEVKRLREELKQTRESLWWCYDNYRFDGHPMTDVDWNFIGNLLGADYGS